MYYLNKVVGWCLSPMGILFLGIAAAGVLRRFRRLRLAAWTFGLTLAFTWVMSCPFVTRFIGAPLEVPVVEPGSLPQADAIVLLGGGMCVHKPSLRPEICASADRVWTAARLWRLGKAPRVFVTGEKNELSTKALLVDLGVSTNAMVFFDLPRNTEEEAREVKAILGEAPSILLVTSAWHMPRARMLFERVGFRVVEAATDDEMGSADEWEWKIGNFLPNVESQIHNAIAIKEWVARFGYRVLRR